MKYSTIMPIITAGKTSQVHAAGGGGGGGMWRWGMGMWRWGRAMWCRDGGCSGNDGCKGERYKGSQRVK